MSNQIDKSKGPGVFIPPPLFYVLIFIASVFIQKMFPITDALFQSRIIKVVGIICFIGNWWNIILFPVLFLIIQEYIIKREEKYLELEFGQQYADYRKKVRRWL